MVPVNIFCHQQKRIGCPEQFFSVLSTLSLEEYFSSRSLLSCTEARRPVANQPCVQHQLELNVTGPFSPTAIYWGTCRFTNHVSSWVIELLLLVGIPATKNLQSPGDHGIKWSDVTRRTKLVQVITFVLLRYRIPSDRFKENTLFYFKVLLFYNLDVWLDSMVNSDSDPSPKLPDFMVQRLLWWKQFTRLF